MTKKGVAKSLGLTLLGIVLFLVKIPGVGQSAFNFTVAFIQDSLGTALNWVLLVFISLAWIGTLLGTVLHNSWIASVPKLKKTFVGKKMQMVTLSIALFVVFSYLFLPLDFLNVESESLLELCGDMVVFMIIAKLVLPLLSDFGLSEMLEVYLRPIMKPFLEVPGSALINLLTGVFVSVTVAVVMVCDQFRKAVYQRKEAVICITCMTIPSMPFTMLALNAVGQIEYFGRFYLYLVVVCLIVSAITVRLLPISRIPEEYVGGVAADVAPLPEGPKWKQALTRASEKALATGYHPVTNVVDIVLNMISFIPYTLAWGTLMKLILAYTNIVNIVTYPYGLWLKLFGIEQGLELSPVIVLNFIDVVMPTVLLSEVGETAVVLRILCMTLGEMVYIAPLLIALACNGLTNIKEQLGIWFVRLVLLVPVASLLYPVFFMGI